MLLVGDKGQSVPSAVLLRFSKVGRCKVSGFRFEFTATLAQKQVPII